MASENVESTPPPPEGEAAQASIGTIEDFEEEAKLYSLIQQDPRYVRWLRKLCPKFLSIQKLKAMVDPSSIPFVGLAVNSYRAQDTFRRKGRIQKFEGEMSDSKMEQMNEAVNVETASLTTKVAVSASLHAVPMGQLLGPLTDVVGNAAAQAFTPLIKMAVSKAAQETAKATSAASSQSRDVQVADKAMFQKWGGTRAFFLYLGYPRTDDELYDRWEKARLILKASFGAAPDEDLYIMKPKGETKKKLRKMEKDRGEYNMSAVPDVSVLTLLWRTYRCWDLPYFDIAENWALKGRSAFNLSDDQVRAKVRAMERKDDYDIIQKMLNPDDPHVMRLKGGLAKKETLALLLNTYGSNRMSVLPENVEEKEKKAAKKAAKEAAEKEKIPDFRYKVIVEFREARNLIAADMNGTSDPYGVAKFLPLVKSKKAKVRKVKTRVAQDTLNPRWTTTKELLFHDVDEILEVQINDYDRFNSNDCIGKCSFKMSDLKDNEPIEGWYPLKQVKHGEVSLKLTRVPITEPIQEEKEKVEKPKAWLTQFVMGQFSSGDGQSWMYFDEGDENPVQAVALYEPPKKRLNVSKNLAKSSIMGGIKLGPTGYKAACNWLGKEDEANEKVRKLVLDQKKQKKVGIIHWFAYRNEEAAKKLISAISNNPYPTLLLTYPEDKSAAKLIELAKGEWEMEDAPAISSKNTGGVQFLYRPSPDWYSDEDRKSKDGKVNATMKAGLSKGKGCLVSAGSSVGSGASSVAGAVGSGGKAIGSGASSVAGAVGSGGKAVGSGAVAGASAVGSGAVSGGKAVGSGAASVAGAVGSGGKAVGSGAASVVGSSGKAVGSGAASVAGAVGSGGKAVGGAVGSGGKAVGKGVKGVTGAFKKVGGSKKKDKGEGKSKK